MSVKPITNKKRYKSGSKFNPKDIDLMTVKELKETYDSAKAFVSACESTFSSMIGISNKSVTSNYNDSSSLYNDEPLLGGSVGKTFSDYNDYDKYAIQDVYLPPTDITDRHEVSALPLSTSSHIPERIHDNDLDSEIYSGIEEELKLLVKQQITKE
jgi:hypothetical protein